MYEAKNCKICIITEMKYTVGHFRPVLQCVWFSHKAAIKIVTLAIVSNLNPQPYYLQIIESIHS